MQGRDVPIKDVRSAHAYPPFTVPADVMSRYTQAGRDRKDDLRRHLGKTPRRLLSELYSRRHRSMRQ